MMVFQMSTWQMVGLFFMLCSSKIYEYFWAGTLLLTAATEKAILGLSYLWRKAILNANAEHIQLFWKGHQYWEVRLYFINGLDIRLYV